MSPIHTPSLTRHADLSRPVQPNSTRGTREDLTNAIRTVLEKDVRRFDVDNAESAGKFVLRNVQDKLAQPDQREMVLHLLDNRFLDERSVEDTDLMSDFEDHLLLDPGYLSPKSKKAVEFTPVAFENCAHSGCPVSVTVTRADDNPKIYISRHLGFREAILASQLSVSDLIVKTAKGLGIDVPDGDVASSLFTTLSNGEFPNQHGMKSAPAETTIMFDGQSVQGVARWLHELDEA